jgi:hypothetical protein
MTRLSREFLEKIAIREKTIQNTQELIDRELRLLVEEIATRYTK